MAVAVIGTDNTAWSATEKIVKQRPTSNDIHETRAVLSDFGITKPIPHFMTLSQLLRWRRQEIDIVMNEYEQRDFARTKRAKNVVIRVQGS
jgi:hypothetical protein